MEQREQAIYFGELASSVDWTTGVVYLQRSTNNGCSAVLVTPSTVLTAAHCLQNPVVAPVDVAAVTNANPLPPVGPQHIQVLGGAGGLLPPQAYSFRVQGVSSGSFNAKSEADIAQDLVILHLPQRFPRSIARPRQAFGPEAASACENFALAGGFSRGVMVGYGPTDDFGSFRWQRNWSYTDEWELITIPGVGGYYKAGFGIGEPFEGTLSGDSGGALIAHEFFGEFDPPNVLCGIFSTSTKNETWFVDRSTAAWVQATEVQQAFDSPPPAYSHIHDARGFYRGTCSATWSEFPGVGEDVDADNDSIPDACDPCPNQPDPTYWLTGQLQADFDCDAVPDSADNCPSLPNADQANTDGDAYGDLCDTCIDQLSPLPRTPCTVSVTAQVESVCLGSLPDAAGSPNFCVGLPGQQGVCAGPVDSDGDAIAPACDNCPQVDNPLQTDTDGDGQGDACDADDDNDGVDDESDNCPLVYQTFADDGFGDPDHDGMGNACDPDDDGDGVDDVDDNCRLVPNPDQAESDGDAVGDACDLCHGKYNVVPDAGSDGDGLGDSCDDCPGTPNTFACSSTECASLYGAATPNCTHTANPRCMRQTDTDHDGRGDACDNCIDVPNVHQRNCNAAAEQAYGTPTLGDDCDPTPCVLMQVEERITDTSLSQENPRFAYPLSFEPLVLPWQRQHGDVVFKQTPKRVDGDVRWCDCEAATMSCLGLGACSPTTTGDGQKWANRSLTKKAILSPLEPASSFSSSYQLSSFSDAHSGGSPSISPISGYDEVGTKAGRRYWQVSRDVGYNQGVMLPGVLGSLVTGITRHDNTLVPDDAARGSYASGPYTDLAKSFVVGRFDTIVKGARVLPPALVDFPEIYFEAVMPTFEDWPFCPTCSHGFDRGMVLINPGPLGGSLLYRTPREDLGLEGKLGAGLETALLDRRNRWVIAGEPRWALDGQSVVAAGVDEAAGQVRVAVPRQLASRTGVAPFEVTTAPRAMAQAGLPSGQALWAASGLRRQVYRLEVAGGMVSLRALSSTSAVSDELQLSGELPAQPLSMAYRHADRALYVLDQKPGWPVPRVRLLRIDIDAQQVSQVASWPRLFAKSELQLVPGDDGELMVLSSNKKARRFVGLVLGVTGSTVEVRRLVEGKGHVVGQALFDQGGVMVPVWDESLGISVLDVPRERFVPRHDCGEVF